ncbi:unnamed protein product [Rhizoctonia solani]|nr:unnamed protein product [Rhizoctonia solani]
MTESAIFSAELMLVKSLDSLRTQQFGLLDGLVVSFVTTMVLSFCIATHPVRFYLPIVTKPLANGVHSDSYGMILMLRQLE